MDNNQEPMDDIDDINQHLDLISSQLYTTPQIALERARHILSASGIDLPDIQFLPHGEDHEAFQLEDEDLYVYFGYCMDVETTLYHVNVEVVDSDGLEEIENELNDEDDIDPPELDTSSVYEETLDEDYTTAARQQSRIAARWAKSMGLIYLGFGRYGDKNHVVKYIVKNHRLVPVLNDEHQKKMTDSKKALEYYSSDLKYHKEAYGNTPEDVEAHVKDEFGPPHSLASTPGHNATIKEIVNKRLAKRKELEELLDKHKKIYDEAKENLDREMGKLFFQSENPIEIALENKEKIEKALASTDDKQRKMAEKFEEHYSKMDKNLTYNEKHAVSYYTGSGSTSLIIGAVKKAENPEEYEKEGKEIKDEFKKSSWHNENDQTWFEKREQKMHDLDEAIEAIPIPEDCILFSGLKLPFEKAEHFKRNEKVVFSGYLSTTFNRNVAHGFTYETNRLGTNKYSDMVVQIKAKKGQSGYYVGNRSEHSGEDEMILPRNTVFRVVAEPQIVKGLAGDSSYRPDTVVISLEIDDQL